MEKLDQTDYKVSKDTPRLVKIYIENPRSRSWLGSTSYSGFQQHEENYAADIQIVKLKENLYTCHDSLSRMTRYVNMNWVRVIS